MDSGTPTRTQVILTGTDPTSPRGGIGAALSGYAGALQTARIDYTLIPSYRPDVLGGRSWWAVRAAIRIGASVLALRRTGFVPVVYAHGGRGLGLIRQAILLYIARTVGARTMLQLHSIAVDSYLRSRLGRAFLKICLFPANRVCVLTEWWRPRLEAVHNPSEIVVIPNPLPPELEKVAREDAADSEDQWRGRRLHVLTMARLVVGKGVDVAIRTMCELPHCVTLTVAGDGNQKVRYEQLTRELGLADRVQFVGWVEGHEKESLLRACDVLLLPSLYDSFGMTFLEAMAFGMPVVASRAGPIEQVVPDGVAGLLVEGQEPAKLAEAVLRLMDDTLRHRLGAGGRTWVIRQFSIAVVGRMLWATIDGLVDGGSQPDPEPVP